MSMYRIVHNESGKECIIEIDKYDNAEIKRKASEQLNLPIDIKAYGQIKIIPLT